MPLIPFPTERVLHSATFIREHIAFTAISYFLNLHLENCSG